MLLGGGEVCVGGSCGGGAVGGEHAEARRAVQHTASVTMLTGAAGTGAGGALVSRKLPAHPSACQRTQCEGKWAHATQSLRWHNEGQMQAGGLPLPTAHQIGAVAAARGSWCCLVRLFRFHHVPLPPLPGLLQALLQRVLPALRIPMCMWAAAPVG